MRRGGAALVVKPHDGTIGEREIRHDEVKLNRGFTLEADATTTIKLDFDGDRSIRETGNGVYMMNPVIAILSVTPSTPPQP